VGGEFKGVVTVFKVTPFYIMLLVDDLLLQILLDNRVLFPTPLCRQVFVCDHHVPFPSHIFLHCTHRTIKVSSQLFVPVCVFQSDAVGK